MKKIIPSETIFPVEKKINAYNSYITRPFNKTIHIITMPLILFGVIGLVWCIPFPHLAFLKQYNGFVNWASFLIAALVYYYYRYVPSISYLILLFVFGSSAGIVFLEKWRDTAAGPQVWVVCGIVLIFSLAIRFVGSREEAKQPGWSSFVMNVLDAPFAVFSSLVKKH